MDYKAHHVKCTSEYTRKIKRSNHSLTEEERRDVASFKAEVASRYDQMQTEQREEGMRTGETVKVMIQARKEITARVCGHLSPFSMSLTPPML